MNIRPKGYLKYKVVKSTSSFSGSSRDYERKLFMDEIKVMKRVSDGGNPHVLKMLGCVTTTNPMMLVLQFVPHGSLKNYLRAMRTGDDVRNNITPYTFKAHTACHAHTQSNPICCKSKTFICNHCRMDIPKPLVVT